MAIVLSIPIWAGEKTIVINRNEGIYEDGTGVYYCSKGGITMTFSSGLNNVNYLVEHQQVVFDIFSTNYVIKKIKFNCLDNTTDDNLDCFYWGPSTISELGAVATYTPTGTYTWSGYIGTWVGGSTPSKYVKFVTEAKPVRFGSVEITIDKEFGDIYDLVTQSSEIAAGQTYALVSKYDSRALGKEEYHGSDAYTTFSSTPVTLLNFDQAQNNYMKVKVTDEVALMKLQSSGNSDRPWYIKIGDNYMRRRTGTLSGSDGAANGQGYNLYTESTVQSGREQYFRTNIAIGNNSNALIRFQMFSSETPLGTETFAIRHYNGGDLFRVIDYNTSNNQYANNQRVYLYKPAQTYYVTTNCQPNDNSGYITLGEGVLNDGNGNYTSQQYDNVNFFVGPTEGWGVGAVTVTNLTTNEVTTLTPTATGDFGNDYEFPMPAANVNVTANFLPPVEIDTICNPADGGQFNFINGYTNFSGQYYSNEGKTVTFKPTAAEGYIFQSVTITDNGVITTMTPDADGVYSFVMPDHEVTLTANFEQATDLYLLGTANGRTNWIPSGPKFNFDGQKYYLDVYFKGGNDDANTDPAYGYFSLTKKIDENGNWNNINGYRLGAEYNNYWVENGSTAQLWPNRNDNAFKIPPGVYRIEVNQEMTEISIIEYPLTVTFDPVSGTVVESGAVVNFTSNLNELVHGINSQEVQATYNSYDNWGATTSDNTHTITHDGTTTVTGQSKIGYITATGTADYEIVGDLYLLGTANGGSWAPTGPKFTFDGENYYLDVYFKGGNVGQDVDPAYGYFSLTTQVGNDWNDIKNYRLAAQYNNYEVADGSTGVGLYGGEQYINNAFKIPAGVYRITVNKAKTQMSITEYPLSLTFDPASGTTVAAGDPVNISCNLDQLVHGINPNEDAATFTYATSTDGTLPTPDTQGSTVNITAVGATTTVNAQATLGYIIVPGNANYTVPAPTVYSITTSVLPEDSNAGTITAPSGSEADQTVTFTVTNNDPATYTLSVVEVYNSYGALVDVTDNGDGTYTFTMPNDDVTISTTYVPTQYTLTTSWTPSDGGAIWVDGVNTPQTVSKDNGKTVTFGVTTAPGYELVSITVTNTTTGEEITTTPSGSNEYTFTMPTGNVAISAVYDLGDLYMVGTVMGRGTAVPSGPKFTYDAENEQYYLDVYFTGANGQLSAFDFFALASHVSDFEWRNRGEMLPPNDQLWRYVTGRLAPATDNYLVDGNSVNVPLSTDPQATGTVHSFTNDFMIPAGIYRVTVNKAKTLMSITEVPVHITFTPHGGTVDNPTIVEPGQQVTIDSDVQTLVNAIDQAQGLSELQQMYLIKDDPDAGWTESDNILITREGQTTVYGYIVIGFLGAQADSVYAILPHNITTVNAPVEGGTINITSETATDNLEIAGQTVTFTVDLNGGYALNSVEVYLSDGQIVPLTENQDGTYSFVMPEGDVTISAEYEKVAYHVTTVIVPPGAGQITFSDSSIQEWIPIGQEVQFSESTNYGYSLNDVTLSYVDENNVTQTITLIPDENGNYNFVMPEADITITANYSVLPVHTIRSIVTPFGAGYVIVKTTAVPSEEVSFTVVKASGYSEYDLYSVRLATNDSQDTTTLTPTNGSYSFVMPDEDVTILVEYRRKYDLFLQWRPQDCGVAAIEGSSTGTSDYLMEGTIVTIDVTPNTNYAVSSITSTVPSVTFIDNGDGTYSFVMPANMLTVTVHFGPAGAYQVNVVNDPDEGGSIGITGHVRTENGNYYSDEGETVVITPTPTAGWSLTSVDVTDAENNPVDVYDNGDGTYSLVMPASDVTVTAHYLLITYDITTYVTPQDCGTVTLMGDAADYNEPAGSTVIFKVEPIWGYEVNRLVVLNRYSSTVSVTDNGNGIYSFVMPESDVQIRVELKAKEYVFRQVLHTRDIIEGGTYIYVSKFLESTIRQEGSNTTPHRIDGWLDDNRYRVKVDGASLMFQLENVVDTTFTPQSDEYGRLDNSNYKASYLKSIRGSYLGLADNPTYPFTPELFNVASPYEKFANLRALLRVQEDYGTWKMFNTHKAVWSYYDHVWPYPLVTEVTQYGSGVLLEWELGYFNEFPFGLDINTPVYLYKLPQPFNVSVQCVEPEWGTVQLTGVDGNIAMDGDTITVTPIPESLYGIVDLTVTIDDTGETVDVIRNSNGTYSFMMPAADVTVTALFGPGHKLTFVFDPENFEAGEFIDVEIDNNHDYPHSTHCVYNDIVPNTRFIFDFWLEDYYTFDQVTMTNDRTGEVSTVPMTGFIVPAEDNIGYGYTCSQESLLMPNDDVTITVKVLPAHIITCRTMLNDEENDECGDVSVIRADEPYWTGFPYYAAGQPIEVSIHQSGGYKLDHVTAVNNVTGESFEMDLDEIPEDASPGFHNSYRYSNFIMPDADVTITAYFVPFTPLALIEAPRDDYSYAPVSEDHVIVSDELIGAWAVQELLWVKDQKPFISNDFVERPDGTIDYVRQNMKLQKGDWDQSNWAILDFSQIDGWTGSEQDFMRVEDYLDHKIEPGSISGTYYCEGDEYKAQHTIVLDDWPVIVNPSDINSLGYPGYWEDPKEEITTFNYKYNHYVPCNFLPENIGGRFGEAGEEGAVPGNPAYENVRMFFMNPKDCEIAQVWAVWLGTMEFYSECDEGTITGDVFETFEPDYEGGVNTFNFAGAFYVPDWGYNRRSLDRNDYGFPDGENTLEKNAEYLFHVAIMTRGTFYYEEPMEPQKKAPRRGQGTQAMEVEPWSHYMVYPLDLDPSESVTTDVKDINTPASTTIDSIRYYNMMGQESETPFEGINIRVIRYKDGSFTSTKIRR